MTVFSTNHILGGKEGLYMPTQCSSEGAAGEDCPNCAVYLKVIERLKGTLQVIVGLCEREQKDIIGGASVLYGGRVSFPYKVRELLTKALEGV